MSDGFLSGAAPTPSNGLVLASMVAPTSSQVRSVVGSAGSSGASPTVLDLLKNGASMYHGSAPKPTIGAGKSGKFSLALPTDRALQQWDVVSLLVLTAGGHGGVVATAQIETP
jgi:hypothetical protein